MPSETLQAVQWALTQTYTDYDINDNPVQFPITKDDAQPLVDAVRQYFNMNKIAYDTFMYSDLNPFLS